ncbi:MAG: type II toxin-antitoxin system HicB family antitoxin [Armatimonadetes bacterium]|nr:type II toxin-antitoxin system HicB family antitoxin [Armatimonadota bacterium]
MADRKLSYTVVLREEPEGGYTIVVPAVPGVVSYGENLEQARAMAKEAIELMLDFLAEQGKPIPVETDEDALHLDEDLSGPITLIRVTVTLKEKTVA